MIPSIFPDANTVFGAPPDLNASQCHPIPAFLGKIQGGNTDGADIVIVAWKPNAEEIHRITLGGPIFLTCLGGLPPHFISTSFKEASFQ